MKEYLILLHEFESPEGRKGDFLGKRNKRKSALLSDLSELFESYSKNTLMHGWEKEKQARPHYGLAKMRFPDAQIITVDVLEKPAKLEFI